MGVKEEDRWIPGEDGGTWEETRLRIRHRNFSRQKYLDAAGVQK